MQSFDDFIKAQSAPAGVVTVAGASTSDDDPKVGLALELLRDHVPELDLASSDGVKLITTIIEALDGATEDSAQAVARILPTQWQDMLKRYRGLSNAFDAAIRYGVAMMERQARHAKATTQLNAAIARMGRTWLKGVKDTASDLPNLADLYGIGL